MLQRSTQVGEFYRMAPPKVFNKKDGAATDLPGQYLDIVIYDEEMDRHVHITARQALEAAMHGQKHMKGPSGGFFGTKEYLEKKYNEAGITAKALVVDPTGAKKDGLTAAEIATSIEGSVWHPVEIIIARPFIEHLMMSAVIAVAGRDTGATLFGPADMSVETPDRTHTARPSTSSLSPPLLTSAARALLNAHRQISANTSVKTIEGAHADLKLANQTSVHGALPTFHHSYLFVRLSFSGHYTCQYANADLARGTASGRDSHRTPTNKPPLVCPAAPSPSSPSPRTSWSSATSCAPATSLAATRASSARRPRRRMGGSILVPRSSKR